MESLKDIFEATFSTPDGRKALQALREYTHYDSRTNICESDRQLLFQLGKVDVFDFIDKTMNQKPKKKYGRRTNRQSEY